MSLKDDVVLVTGAAGFLGKRLVQMLLEEEEETVAEIRLLDRRVPAQLLESFNELRGDTRVRVFEGDIRDGDFLKNACRGASTVFHMASIIDVIGAVEYKELHGVNVKGTQMLLEACLEENVVSFIYTSTLEVMGPNSRGEAIVNGDESTVYHCALKFPYSRTKKEAERLALQANGDLLRNGGRLATCALRPMYIYGEGCRFLLGHVRDGIRNNDVLYRISAPEAKVNPVYVGNVAAAHIQASRGLKDPHGRNRIGGNFYFVSDDTPHLSYSDFNHVMASPLGFRIQDRHFLPLRLLYVACLVAELVCFLLRPFVRVAPALNRQLLTMCNTPFSFSYQKAGRDLGYEPRFSWQEARRRTVEWLAGQLPLERERLGK